MKLDPHYYKVEVMGHLSDAGCVFLINLIPVTREKNIWLRTKNHS